MEKMVAGRFALPMVLLLGILMAFPPAGIIPEVNGAQAPSITPGVRNATVGESFSVSVEWKEAGSLLLETSYPNTNYTWIMKPSGKEGDIFEFDMPAPYSRGNISIRVHYGPGSDEVPLSITGELFVPIQGWSDTDLDGLDDSWEERYGVQTRPIDHDPDDDGMDLMAEMFNLTDPGRKDSDGDSMEDPWESLHGTLPFRDDPNDDPDRDGWSNVREKNRGTDPRDPEDHPDEPPVTPWYWTLIIVGVLVLILLYFVRQLFSKRKLEDDMEDFDARTGETRRAENLRKTGKL
ncbi:MAG: hypothetical protein ACMUHB_00330 [Thermoplasmatota archaeon]